MADRQTGSLDREVYALEFELDASEFQGTEWVQEEDQYSPPTSGASSSGLIPRLETPEYVRSALARELLAEPRFEDAAQCYTPATDSKCEATRVLPLAGGCGEARWNTSIKVRYDVFGLHVGSGEQKNLLQAVWGLITLMRNSIGFYFISPRRDSNPQSSP